MFTEDTNPDTIILKNTSDFSQVYEMIRSLDFAKNITIDISMLQDKVEDIINEFELFGVSPHYPLT